MCTGQKDKEKKVTRRYSELCIPTCYPFYWALFLPLFNALLQAYTIAVCYLEQS